MPSTKSLNLSETTSDDALKHPYIVYTVISLLVLNILLIAYLSYKIFRLYRRKPKSNFEKKNRRYRVLIFVLIFLSLLLRAIFEADQVLGTIFYDSTAHLEPILLIIDALPSLLFVNIACVFCYFWYELYTSFDDNMESSEDRVSKYKMILITVNLTLYFAFVMCSIFHLSQDSKEFAIAMRVMCALSLIFSIAMLKIHGNRLYSRALMLIAYTGRTAKSSGFRTLYIILLICCILKLIKEGVVLYFSISVGEDLLQDLDNIQEGYNLPIFILYVIVFYIFGEYGLFLSLILMMDSYANKSRVSFTEQETYKGAPDDELLDNDHYAHTATSSRIIPVQHFEDGEVSVTFAS